MAIIHADFFQSTRNQTDLAGYGVQSVSGVGSATLDQNSFYTGGRYIRRCGGSAGVNTVALQADAFYVRDLGVTLDQVLKTGGVCVSFKAKYDSTVSPFRGYMAWDGTRILIINKNNQLITTSDFKSYMVLATLDREYASLKFNNGYGYAIGQTVNSPRVMRFTTDGTPGGTVVQYSSPTSPGYTQTVFTDVYYDGTAWCIAGGNDASTFQSLIMRSTDFAAWTNVYFSSGSNNTPVVMGKIGVSVESGGTNQWFAITKYFNNVSAVRRAFYSNDKGASWVNWADGRNWQDVTYFNGMYLVALRAYTTGGVAASIQGVYSGPSGGLVKRLDVSMQQFCKSADGLTAYGLTSNGQITKSTDGVSWSQPAGAAVRILGNDGSTSQAIDQCGFFVANGYIYVAAPCSAGYGGSTYRVPESDLSATEFLDVSYNQLPTTFAGGSVGAYTGLFSATAGSTPATLVPQAILGVAYRGRTAGDSYAGTGALGGAAGAFGPMLPDTDYQIDCVMERVNSSMQRATTWVNGQVVYTGLLGSTAAALSGNLYVYLAGNQFTHISDLVVTDFTSPLRGRLGDIRGLVKNPASDVSTLWTKVGTQPSNAKAVSRVLSASGNSSVESSAITDVDTYATDTPVIPAGFQPVAMQLENYASSGLTNPQSIVQVGLVVSGTEQMAARQYVPGTTQQYRSSILPARADWSIGLSAANIRVKRRTAFAEPALLGTEVLAIDAEAGLIDISSYARTIVNSGVTQSPLVYHGQYGMGFSASASLTPTIAAGDPLILGTSDFTIEMWVLPTENRLGLVFDTRNASVSTTLAFYITATLALQSAGNAVDYTTAKQLTLGVWQHLAFVRQGNVLNIYVNGSLFNSAAFTRSLSTNSFRIGQHATLNTQGFPGAMDTLRVYKFAKYTSEFIPV